MLSDIPIRAFITPSPTSRQKLQAEQLADAIRSEHPELAADEQYQKFVPDSLSDGCCLLFDDLSEIKILDSCHKFLFMQDRARLRAGDGDMVASVLRESEGYEDYCRQSLKLGTVDWLRPNPTANPLQIAHACWEDRQVRHELLHRLRTDALHYLHPHMGTLGGWELAALLHQHSRRPVKVIAPPPVLARFVNNKVSFTDVARRLLGLSAVPQTASAWNMATLSQRICEMSEAVQTIGVKRPDSAGGAGIVVIPMEKIRGRSLQDVHDILGHFLEPLCWDDGSELLIGSWEADVLCSPSVQLWIPPEGDGAPIVEGIFSQHMTQRTVKFEGTGFVEFSAEITRELSTHAWLIARVFQKLGYIGRCSFDTILVGESFESARIEFIECNGRWGGTSLPMTLMNRLFGDWKRHPFAVRVVGADGLGQISFSDFVSSVADHAYDARTGCGDLIFYSPGRLHNNSQITVLALAENWIQACLMLQTTVPELLNHAASSDAVG